MVKHFSKQLEKVTEAFTPNQRSRAGKKKWIVP
jgi:hypothetical protein